MNYSPLCVKTDYSLLSSLIKIDTLIQFLHAYKISACAICDNNLSGSIEFYNKLNDNNIKPMIGLDITYNNYHLYLYAKNYNGYKNLLKINTLVEMDEINIINLIKYFNDIILIMPYESIMLMDEFKFYNDIFIGYKNNEEKVNALLLTNNIIFINPLKVFKKEDIIYLEYLNGMGGLNSLKEEIYPLKPSDEDIKKINDFIQLINIEFPLNENYIPVFDPTKDSFEYLKSLAKKGLEKRLKGNVLEAYEKRLNYELEVIKKMGFTDYFLICYDYVLYAKKNNVLVGPGRGSAAGSLVCYSIGITDIDPLQYNLLFERFLNPDRITMPDIDIDFDSEKRELIIDYVKEKYGYKYVAVGLTFNTLKAKSVLREVAKLLKIDNNLVDRFIKEIDREKYLKGNLEKDIVKKYLDNYPELKKLYAISQKLEGLKKNVSTHAAGIVISKVQLDDVIPIKVNNKNITTGITMDYLENIGLLKMDFLGLKNLTLIANILAKTDKDLLKNIDLDDKVVINIFKNGKTDGIFQYETSAMKSLLGKLKPDSFEEIIAAVALVRPGPNMFLDEYIKNKNNIDKIKYIDESLKNILKETYGIILYQEQIINILTSIGGFTNGEADLIRRAISKKKVLEIKSAREKFIEGAILKNISKINAENIFAKILLFSGYGFNKSHSVAYALIGYQMAYLKVYYPEHFFKEYLNETKDNRLIQNLLREIKNNNVKIIRPDINFSDYDYILNEKNIVLPLTLIKGIQKDVAINIIENKPYIDYFDFVLKNPGIKINLVEILAYAGAFRSLKLNAKTIINNYDIAFNYAELKGFGEKPIIQSLTDFDESFLREKELELYGFYVGNHPSSKYQDKKIMKLVNLNDNLFKNVFCVVTVNEIKKIKTKKGDEMAFLNLSDETANEVGILFKDQIHYLNNLNKNELLFITGKVSKSFDKTRIIINNIKKEKEQ